jgi:predicted N-acyltransferase
MSAAGGPGRPADPFTTWRFLRALEESGSVGRGSGWTPRHLVARAAGAVIAVLPLYAKSHSQGEYIFDHNWAHAWERAGGDYYPKLQAAVPFTPATGRRFLTRPGAEAEGRAALVQGALALAQQSGVSSLHVTFCTAEERAWGEEIGLLGPRRLDAASLPGRLRRGRHLRRFAAQDRRSGIPLRHPHRDSAGRVHFQPDASPDRR